LPKTALLGESALTKKTKQKNPILAGIIAAFIVLAGLGLGINHYVEAFGARYIVQPPKQGKLTPFWFSALMCCLTVQFRRCWTTAWQQAMSYTPTARRSGFW
jgi:hypothetical protein